MGLILERNGKYFLNLVDTPSDYTGYGGYYLRVKSGEDGLEFVAGGGGGGSGEWGFIIGTLTDQTDLMDEFSYHQRYNFMMHL